MGWGDRLLYALAQGNPTTNAIADYFQGQRASDAINKIAGAKTLQDFNNVSTPDDIYDPKYIEYINNLKNAQQAKLQTLDAVPYQNKLESLDRNPSMQDTASLLKLSTQNPLAYSSVPIGQTTEPTKTYIPKLDNTGQTNTWGNPVLAPFVAKSSGQTAADSVVQNNAVDPININVPIKGMDNPLVVKSLHDFAQDKFNQLQAQKAITDNDPTALAYLVKTAKMPDAFHNVMQGSKIVSGQQTDKQGTNDTKTLMDFIDNFPLQNNTESWNSLVKGAYATGANPTIVNQRLDDIYAHNKTRPVTSTTMEVGTGPNKTTKRISLNMFGEVIPSTGEQSTFNPKISVSNAREPRDRFQIVADSDGTLNRVNLETGEASPVTAAGGKTIKKPLKTKGSATRDMLNGQNTPAAKGYKFVNGKLVPN